MEYIYPESMFMEELERSLSSLTLGKQKGVNVMTTESEFGWKKTMNPNVFFFSRISEMERETKEF